MDYIPLPGKIHLLAWLNHLVVPLCNPSSTIETGIQFRNPGARLHGLKPGERELRLQAHLFWRESEKAFGSFFDLCRKSCIARLCRAPAAGRKQQGPARLETEGPG